MTAEQFACALIEYCRQTGGSITSWGRTELRNAAVGGDVNSFHMSWLAADVVYDAAFSPAEILNIGLRTGRELFAVGGLALKTRTSIANGLGLLLIPEDDHDHLQPFSSSRG